MPSAEQADNRRRGRAEDRIPQIAQDRMGLLTLTVRTSPAQALPQDRGSHHLRTREQQSAPRSGGHWRLRPCRSTATTSD